MINGIRKNKYCITNALGAIEVIRDICLDDLVANVLAVPSVRGKAGDSEFVLTREVFPRTDSKCQHFVCGQRPLRQLDQTSDFHTVNQRQGGDTTSVRTGFA